MIVVRENVYNWIVIQWGTSRTITQGVLGPLDGVLKTIRISSWWAAFYVDTKFDILTLHSELDCNLDRKSQSTFSDLPSRCLRWWSDLLRINDYSWHRRRRHRHDWRHQVIRPTHVCLFIQYQILHPFTTLQVSVLNVRSNTKCHSDSAESNQPSEYYGQCGWFHCYRLLIAHVNIWSPILISGSHRSPLLKAGGRNS